MIPLHSKLSNGATVRDWLGTAGVAAGEAATACERIRSGAVQFDAVEELGFAIRKAEQAAEELRVVQQHCAYVRAFGQGDRL